MQKILISILTQAGSLLISWALSELAKRQKEAAKDEQIDERLKEVKAAYAEALDGQPVTPDQRKRINKAIADFVRGRPSDGT